MRHTLLLVGYPVRAAARQRRGGFVYNTLLQYLDFGIDDDPKGQCFHDARSKKIARDWHGLLYRLVSY